MILRLRPEKKKVGRNKYEWRKKFALLPTHVRLDRIIWLQTYETRELSCYYEYFGDHEVTWCDREVGSHIGVLKSNSFVEGFKQISC